MRIFLTYECDDLMLYGGTVVCLICAIFRWAFGGFRKSPYSCFLKDKWGLICLYCTSVLGLICDSLKKHYSGCYWKGINWWFLSLWWFYLWTHYLVVSYECYDLMLILESWGSLTIFEVAFWWLTFRYICSCLMSMMMFCNGVGYWWCFLYYNPYFGLCSYLYASEVNFECFASPFFLVVNISRSNNLLALCD